MPGGDEDENVGQRLRGPVREPWACHRPEQILRLAHPYTRTFDQRCDDGCEIRARLRDELLNETLFASLAHLHEALAAWKVQYL